jgi:hypothetical protein
MQDQALKSPEMNPKDGAVHRLSAAAGRTHPFRSFITMSLLYASVLVAVFAIVVAEVIATARRASQPLVWETRASHLSLVSTTDRREQALPFVGRERRTEDADIAAADEAVEQPLRRAA